MYIFIILGIVLPIIASPFMLILSDKRRKAAMLTIIASFMFLSIYNIIGSHIAQLTLFAEGGFLEGFVFQEHPYNRIAVFGFTFVGSLALLFGLQTQTKREMAISLWAVVGAIGISIAGDFVTLFLFWEILTFSVAALILIGAYKKGKLSLGLKFLYMHVAGGLFLLFGILLHYREAGSFVIDNPEAGIVFFLIGIAFKSAFLPLHLWVQWGYPTASLSVSVLLSGLTTKVGVYAIARILPPHEGIVLMGASMALVGIFCALLQKNLRGLLSYHIISQVGYMVAGVGLGTAMAVDGGLLHVVNHMIYKALLFMSVGALLYSVGSENVKELAYENESRKDYKAVYKILPVAFTGALIGALSISGVPPFNGYVSKYLLKYAMDGAGISEWMLLLASVGTAISFCKFVYYGFIRAKGKVIRSLPLSMKASISIASVSCLFLGVFPGIMSGLIPYGSSLVVYSFAGIRDASLLIGAGVLVFVFFKDILGKGIPVPAWLSVEYLVAGAFNKTAYTVRTILLNRLEKKGENYFVRVLLDTGYLLRETSLVTLLQRDDNSYDTSEEKKVYKRPIKRPIKESIENINFDQILIFMILGAILLIVMSSVWLYGGF